MVERRKRKQKRDEKSQKKRDTKAKKKRKRKPKKRKARRCADGEREVMNVFTISFHFTAASFLSSNYPRSSGALLVEPAVSECSRRRMLGRRFQ